MAEMCIRHHVGPTGTASMARSTDRAIANWKVNASKILSPRGTIDEVTGLWKTRNSRLIDGRGLKGN